MPRQTREQVEQLIIDSAAALFARHGFAHTSLQAVADAAGYSKAGLLHHFPTKEALYLAAVSSADEHTRHLLSLVDHLPIGRERDQLALESVLDWAVTSPGVVALEINKVSVLDADLPVPGPDDPPQTMLRVFGIEDPTADVDRLVRVVSACAGLLIVTLAARRVGAVGAWREPILTAALDALGHRRPSASPHHPVHAEA